MKRPYLVWYALALVVALAPAGFRVWLRPGLKPLAADAAMARAGEVLFSHEWKEKDPLSPGGDGLGPVYNAKSCVACHKQGGVGGSGGLPHNVTTFLAKPTKPNEKPREGVVHAFATRFQESLAQVDPMLPALVRPTLAQLVSLPGSNQHCLAPSFPRNVHVSQRNTPALFGSKQIDELPERVIIARERMEQLKWGLSPAQGEAAPVGRVSRLANGKIGRFGWKAQSASLSDFVQAACANELGLGNPGQPQPRPLGAPNYQPPGLDLTLDQCDQLTAFCASLPPPVERMGKEGFASFPERVEAGKSLFATAGCADCHTPDLGPVRGVYSDLLLHRMGQQLEGGGSYGAPPPPLPDFSPGDGPLPDEWRTPPLWGVADSAPYMHDGRAATLEQAIELHAGQAARAARAFAEMKPGEKQELVAFLKTLRAP